MRPRLPTTISRPILKPFVLPADAREKLARHLGLETLLDELAGAIEHAVASYRATIMGSETTTKANVRHMLKSLHGNARARKNAIQVLAHESTAVDYETDHALHKLAKRTQGGDPATIAQFERAAATRARQIEEMPRVEPATEALRHFCGVLRVIFNRTTAHLKGRILEEEAWRGCRAFAKEVMVAAGIEIADFEAHPDRLTEYLRTDVTPLV
jgi:hypothetical protein